MRFKYFAARRAGVHLVCIPIVSRSLRTAEHLAVRPKRLAVLNGPLVKQCWIVRELQQCSSNFLRFRHAFVRGIKASFLVCTSGIGHVLHPPDISKTHLKSHLADVQDIRITHLGGAGEGNDAAQISFRAILWVEGV